MTDFLLSNRADLRRAVSRLLSTDGDDDALTENGEAQGDVLNGIVQFGLWNAQKWMIRTGFRQWLATSDALTFDAAAADGTRSVALPDDFLRLAGDEREGALLDSRGRPWGGMIPVRQKRRAGPGAYWIENKRLVLGPRSSPPSGAYIEYHYRHPILATDDEADDPLLFDEDWTPLIPAEAAVVGVHEGWFLRSQEDEAKVLRNRKFWRDEIAPWVRSSQEPQKLRPPEVLGSHIFL